ncbi:MAG: molecular chaperone TorD family protein [Candidatus Binatia bacterium]
MSTVRESSESIVEAARWRILGLLLERPRPGRHEEITALACEIGDRELGEVVEAVGALGEGEYLALLGPGGMVSPREVSYRGLEDPGWVLSDVSRCYAAFAYRPRAEDPPDHVAVEAGFVGYLHLKEGLARAEGDAEAAETTARARETFLAAHLGAIAGGLARKLAELGASPLAAAAVLLAARVPATAATSVPGTDPLAGGCGAHRGACANPVME